MLKFLLSLLMMMMMIIMLHLHLHLRSFFLSASSLFLHTIVLSVLPIFVFILYTFLQQWQCSYEDNVIRKKTFLALLRAGRALKQKHRMTQFMPHRCSEMFQWINRIISMLSSWFFLFKINKKIRRENQEAKKKSKQRIRKLQKCLYVIGLRYCNSKPFNIE